MGTLIGGRLPACWAIAAILSLAIGAAAPCAAAAKDAFYANSFSTEPSAADLAAAGRLLFFDQSLSASGKVACASCHDPEHAYGPANGAPVQLAGVRAVPSLMYAQNVPPFTQHFVDDEDDDSIDQGPAGGLTWDGRAQSAHEQARLPLLSQFEMANSDADAVVARIEHGPYAGEFRRIFGATVFEDKAMAFKAVLLALEAYQQTSQDFYPYSSKFDAWLRGEATLSEQEARGMAAFNDPAKGNCARCHTSAVRGGAFPQFTDFGYAAIGVPRNRAIAANATPDYFDLGLCGPWRRDLAASGEFCGMFRTPTLRNVALRKVFFHNGVFHRLDQAVRFYALRDTQPERWYPRRPEGVQKFDDLPIRYQGNIDVQPPFDKHRGEPPALSEADVSDIVAFLKTLTDGYRPAAAAKPRLTAR